MGTEALRNYAQHPLCYVMLIMLC